MPQSPSDPMPSGLALRRLQAQIDRMDGRIEVQVGRRETQAAETARRGEIVAEIVRTSNAVVERSLGEGSPSAPTLAFSLLIEISLGNLGAALAHERPDLAAAMVANLRALAEAVAVSARHLDGGEWMTALVAFPPTPPLVAHPDPHPQATVYSPLLAQVRDRGLALGSLRQIFVPSWTPEGPRLHIVR